MHLSENVIKIELLLLKVLFVAAILFYGLTVYGATLSLSPSTGVYTAGQTFSAKVVVNTSGASINAADGTLTFNPKEITVTGISKGSIFNLWTAEPAYSNSNGTITFSGGSPTGYTGSGGTVINITFKAASAGSPRVSFSKGSVLAADGRGTNVLTNMNGGAYTIAAAGATPVPEEIEYVAPANTPKAPQVVSSTHPDSSKWYQVKNAELSWAVEGGVTAVRTLLDSSAASVPTKVYESAISNISLSNLDEGVQYFHIQFKNKDGWGRVAHYKLAVDTQKPTAFDITLNEGSDLSNPTQTLKLTAQDATSKVKRFLIQLDGKDPYEYIDEQGSSTVQLPPLEPGHHTAIIEAFDEAGNGVISTFSFSILAFDKPQFTEYPKEINEQVIPVLKGITRPNAKVEISMLQVGLSISRAEAVKTYEVQSSENGEFIFIPDGRLSLGVYEVTAVAIDQYGAQSEASDAIRIAVQQPGYMKIGSFIVSFLSVLIPLVALLGLLILGTGFMLAKLRTLKKGVTKEAHEAATMLTSEFASLRSHIEKEKTNLESSRKTKKLTKAESELFESLSTALKTSEKRVQKEIGDVEELFD